MIIWGDRAGAGAVAGTPAKETSSKGASLRDKTLAVTRRREASTKTTPPRAMREREGGGGR